MVAFEEWIKTNTYHKFNNETTELFMYDGRSYYKFELYKIYELGK